MHLVRAVALLHSPPPDNDVYTDWNTRMDNFVASVLTRLSDSSSHVVSSADALKLCYFTTGLARFLVAVQQPREKWFKVFDSLIDRMDTVTDELGASLNDDKASVADHMFNMMCWAERDNESWTWTVGEEGEEEAYTAWLNSWREDDTIFPDRLLESIAPYAPKTGSSTAWRVRRVLDRMEATSPNLKGCV